jgi:hypothetical protein
MDNYSRQNILKQLIKKQGDKIDKAIKAEAKRIDQTLKDSGEYSQLWNQLESLQIIAPRISEAAIEITTHFLNRLENGIDLTLDDASEKNIIKTLFRSHYTVDNLIIKCLELLNLLRYVESEKILNIYFEYLDSKNRDISKKAESFLCEFARYDTFIFHGNNQEFKGLRTVPQKMLLSKLNSFSNSFYVRHLSTVLQVCHNLLSTEMTTSWSDYKKITIQHSSIPATKEVKEVRIDTILLLKKLYKFKLRTNDRAKVLDTLWNVRREPISVEISQDLKNLIVEDTLNVLKFIRDNGLHDDLEILQKIENLTFWLYYHSTNSSIDQVALGLKEEINKNDEYLIFKTLIGYDGIFDEWTKKGQTEKKSYSNRDQNRRQTAGEWAVQINNSNYDQWKQRIISYTKVESNDLATFPIFGFFLEVLGEKNSDLAYRILTEAQDELGSFVSSLILGGLKSENQSVFLNLISLWIDENKFLIEITRLLSFTKEIHIGIIDKLFDNAIKKKDIQLLNQFVVTIVAQTDKIDTPSIRKYFLPTLKALTKAKNSNWVNGVWFRDEKSLFLRKLQPRDYQVLFNNLLIIPSISYHEEEILIELSKVSSNEVINFFFQRIDIQNTKKDKGYEAIPYEFHKLHQLLSNDPEGILKTSFERFDQDNYMFKYQEGQLLKNIFPEFSAEWNRELISMINTSDEKQAYCVLTILENYNGDENVLDICKPVIKLFHNHEEIIRKVKSIIESTGVVTGEYGFVEALEIKKDEIINWLNDKDEAIKQFAQTYLKELNLRIEEERNRTKERIALMKHDFGSTGD